MDKIKAAWSRVADAGRAVGSWWGAYTGWLAAHPNTTGVTVAVAVFFAIF